MVTVPTSPQTKNLAEAPQLVRIPLLAGTKEPLVVRWSSLPADSPIWADTFRDYPDCNIGLRLDDLVVIDCDSPERVTWWLEQGYPTDFVSRGREERRSYWYRRPDDCDLETKRFNTGWEIRTGSGHQCVVPPSVHPCGRRYEWLGPPVDEQHWWEVPEAPVDALESLVRSQRSVAVAAVDGWDVVAEGEGRDNFLTSVGGLLRAKGAGPAAIRDVLGAVNQLLCAPPLSAADVDRIAHSVARYDASTTYAMADGPDWSPWSSHVAIAADLSDLDVQNLPREAQ